MDFASRCTKHQVCTWLKSFLQSCVMGWDHTLPAKETALGCCQGKSTHKWHNTMDIHT